MKSVRAYSTIFILLFFVRGIAAQNLGNRIDSFFIPAQSFSPVRFYTGVGAGAVVYGAGTYALYNYWYKDSGLGKFHFFNDWNEWNNMDKAGHTYTAYNQSVLMYNAAKWTGLQENKSIYFGMFMGALMQTTIEIMDGFSPKWGFSVSDIGANTLGISIFYFQQKYWAEQRILLKVSSLPVNYPVDKIYDINHEAYTTLQSRADALFGSSFFERYLKDYNAQSYWLSLNLKSLMDIESCPSWLNIALGYGSENMFGGYANVWSDAEGRRYDISDRFPRYHQFFVSPDIDFTRIKVHSHFLKALFRGLNLFKLPAPALEINTRGEFIFHLLYM